MNGAVCPCAVCEERFVGCHVECEVYKAWREAHNAMKDKRRKKHDRDDMLVNFKLTSIEHVKRRHGK